MDTPGSTARAGFGNMDKCTGPTLYATLLLTAAGCLLSLACTAEPAVSAVAPGRSNTVVVEAEQFQYLSQWNPTVSTNCSGGAYLLTAGSDRDALTVIEVPAAATYRLWTRSRCYQSDKPGTRRYRVVVNGQPAERESGVAAVDGWIWEHVGDVALLKGPNVLALRDTAKFFGRCDALLLTATVLDPRGLKAADWAAWQVASTPVTGESAQALEALPRVLPDGAAVIARAASDRVRLSFQKCADSNGAPLIVRTTELKQGDLWLTVTDQDESGALYVIYAPTSRVSVAEIFPAWFSSQNVVRITVRGAVYETCGNAHDPFRAGETTLLVPRQCRQVDERSVEVTYEGARGERATASWSVAEGRRDAHCAVHLRTTRDGDYSLAFCGSQPVAEDNVESVLLPPVFRFKKNHANGFLVTSSMTSHPLALVQTAGPTGTPVTCVVAADPQAMPFQWAQNNNARYGFSLRNAREEVQPVVFQPVLGLPDSHCAGGRELSASWYVLTQPGTWTEALEYVSQTIFGVRDYRRPVNASLSEAVENIFELMADDTASGWDATLKGFAQIESRDTASQAVPLALLEAALLSRDEAFYVKRALPAIEYTLSRPAAHFTATVPAAFSTYVTPASIRLCVPSDFFGTAYWQGLHEMLGRANPWIADLALQPDGQVRWRRSYSAAPRWSELMAAYRLSPSPERLSEIRKEADAFVRKEMHGRKTGDIDLLGFCNVQAYPYWWDLLDLYELTGDRAYLAAAEEGGFHTLASLWSLPTPPDASILVHPGSTFNEHPLMWWRGHAKYRLGWPRKPGDMPSKNVPAWMVANSGLGVEQLSTYYDSIGNRGMQNILMSAWAPHLLRLYNQTGREIFLDYARNGVIGRFANYPGYYVSGYTDAYLDPCYPCCGPDVTDIYYHHIPAQSAFALDFLMAEAEGRSRGAIAFPWVKQQGYVWFSNRIFGGAPGKLFDDTLVDLRLERRAAHVSPEAISCLMARGRDRYWLILMNETAGTVQAQLHVDAAVCGIRTNQPYRVFDAAGAPGAERPFAVSLREDVPAKGLIAVAFPAASDVTVGRRLPPLRDGHWVQHLGEPWGDLHAFRIRSPFGRDSLYVVLTGRPKPGARATLQMAGVPTSAPPLTVGAYPYEFTVYPWPMERDMAFRVTLVDPDHPAARNQEGTLPGTP